MSSHVCPLFRQHFIAESAWSKDVTPGEQQRNPPGAGIKDGKLDPVVKMSGSGAGRGGLVRPLMLDLNFLPRENGPQSSYPDYEELRRQKFAKFEMQCSKVADGLYVSGAAVAQDRAILAQNSITHVVNCVGALYQEYFKNDGIAYKTLWLQDMPHEDITCVLYDTFDFIEAARRGGNSSSGTEQQQQGSVEAGAGSSKLQKQQQQQQLARPADSSQQPSRQQHVDGNSAQAAAVAAAVQECMGRVLVHCSQGVSRSTTIAIAYLMWKTGGLYDEVYQAVRALRGVTSPNVGFMCQLINWAKRRQRPPSRVRIYRIAPHCADDPTYLVPKALSPRPGCSHADWSLLDCRGCFVIHLPDALYVWRGSSCLAVMVEAGWRAAGGLVRYEGAQAAVLLKQGEEPDDLLAALSPSSSSSQPDGSNLVSMEPSTASLQAGTTAGPDTDSLSSAPSASFSRPCSAQQQQLPPAPGQQQQQRQPPPWLAGAPSCSSGGRPSSAMSGASSRQTSLPQQQHQQQQHQQQQHQQQGEADLLSAQLSNHVQLAGGLLGVVGEVDEYSADYELWLRALLRSGGGSSVEAGRLTPRSQLVGLAVDDIATGTSSSSRSASPGTTEGRNRKYRRSDSESAHLVVPSYRQPGRLSASSNPSLWPGTSTGGAAGSAAAAAGPAADAAVAAAVAGQQQLGSSSSINLGRAGSDPAQLRDMKRMSIDEDS